MSRSVNMVFLIGNVGQDPEIGMTKGNVRFATMQVATSRTWNDANTKERRSDTEWHSVITYMNGLIDIIESHVKKGSKVHIRGRIKSYPWTDKNGSKRSDKRILLDGFDCALVVLDGRRDDGERNNHSNSDQFSSNIDLDNELDDNLPF